MKTYQHFASVLTQLLGNETSVRLTVKGYMRKRHEKQFCAR